MFTGLIADRGRVEGVEHDGAGATLRIQTPLAGQLGAGDSIAVNGVCLTAAGVDSDGFVAAAIAETLRRSSLGALRPGVSVNLELPLRADARLGGHLVQGHVDGVGTVREIRPEGGSRVLRVKADDPGLLRYLVEKGSVAVEGVSLTVSTLRAGEGSFEVSLIPETLARTTLGEIALGDRVNLEMDVLAKHLERLMEARA